MSNLLLILNQLLLTCPQSYRHSYNWQHLHSIGLTAVAAVAASVVVLNAVDAAAVVVPTAVASAPIVAVVE